MASSGRQGRNDRDAGDGQNPLHREAHCLDPVPCPAVPLLAGAAQQAKVFTQMHSRCTQNTRIGVGPAWCCTVEPGRPILMSITGALAHVRSACFASICCASALDTFSCLRRRAPHRPAKSGRAAPGHTVRSTAQSKAHASETGGGGLGATRWCRRPKSGP